MPGSSSNPNMTITARGKPTGTSPSNPAVFEAIKDAKREETRARHYSFPSDMIESMAAHEARGAMQKQVADPHLRGIREARKREGLISSLKPVAVLADAPAASVAPPSEEIVMTDDAVIPPDVGTAAEERGEDHPARTRAGNGTGNARIRHRAVAANAATGADGNAVDSSAAETSPPIGSQTPV